MDVTHADMKDVHANEQPKLRVGCALLPKKVSDLCHLSELCIASSLAWWWA